MAGKSKSQIAEEINFAFCQIEEIYIGIRHQCANLASLRRREEKMGQHYMSPDSVRSRDDQLGCHIDQDVLEIISMSFATSVASAAEKISDSMELLRSTALKIVSLCESLFTLVTEIVESQSCNVYALQQIAEALMGLTESVADEVDLISYWTYSNISPELVPTSVSPTFRSASSCLPDKMMTRTIWRNDVYPLVNETYL